MDNRIVCFRQEDENSLQVEKGEFTAIIGFSGSGKSTLLHIIGGVDVPASGKVYLDGQDVYAGSNEKLAIFRRRQVKPLYCGMKEPARWQEFLKDLPLRNF